jgi:hypothetical protein
MGEEDPIRRAIIFHTDPMAPYHQHELARLFFIDQRQFVQISGSGISFP